MVKSYKQRLLEGLSWSLIGHMLCRVLSTLSMIAVARIIEKEAFGELSMIRSTIELFSVFAAFRLGTTATKYVSEYKDSSPIKAAKILKLVLWTSFGLSVCLALLFIAISSFLSENVLNSARLNSTLVIAAFFLVFNTYALGVEYGIAGFQAFKQVAWLNILKGFLTPAVLIPFALYLKLQGVVIGLVIHSAVVLLFARRFLNQQQREHGMHIRLSFRDVRSEMSVLWSFALPGILIGVVYAFVQWMGRVILVNSEHGYGDLGLFAAANQWRSIILFLPAVIGRVFLPLLSEARGTSSSQTYRKMVIDNIRVICAVSLPICAVVIAFSSPLMAIFGKGFHGGEEMLSLLMLSAFFYSIGGPVRQAVDSSGLRWQALSINCIWAIVFLFLAILVVPHRGGIGLAYAHVISAGVLVTMQYLFLDRVICRGTLKAIGAGLIYSLGIVMGIAFLEYSTVLSRAVMVTAILVVLSTLPACQLLLRNGRQMAVYIR